jgi:hypothetical protein
MPYDAGSIPVFLVDKFVMYYYKAGIAQRLEYGPEKPMVVVQFHLSAFCLIA